MDVPVGQDRSGPRLKDASSGLVATGGDFVWYDPYLKCIFNGDIARFRAKLWREHDEDLLSGVSTYQRGVWIRAMLLKLWQLKSLVLLM